MINTIILDIIGNSLNKPYIMLSDDVYKAIKDLKQFNYENIYYKANPEDVLKHYEEMFKTVFNHYLNDLKKKNTDSEIYQVFVGNMDDNYLINNSDEQKVIDFIAGMTDDYFTTLYNKCI
jgi:dGTPase